MARDICMCLMHGDYMCMHTYVPEDVSGVIEIHRGDRVLQKLRFRSWRDSDTETHMTQI